MGDKREKWGVNISGGTFNVDGDIAPGDLHRSSAQSSSIDTKPSAPQTPSRKKVVETSPHAIKTEPVSFELATRSDWSQDKENELKTLSGNERNSAAGQKVVIVHTDEEGILVDIYSDKDIPDDKQSESRKKSKCIRCGGSLSENPYRSTCESCGGDIDQETIKRNVRQEFISCPKENAKVEGKTEAKTQGAENEVRALVTSEKTVPGGMGIKISGSYSRVIVGGGMKITFKDTVILDELVIEGGQKMGGTILVPPSFQGIQQLGGMDIDIDVEIKTWDQILEKINPKS